MSCARVCLGRSERSRLRLAWEGRFRKQVIADTRTQNVQEFNAAQCVTSVSQGGMETMQIDGVKRQVPVVAHTCNSSTQETETGRLGVLNQPELLS